jgi:hypothetical protein
MGNRHGFLAEQANILFGTYPIDLLGYPGAEAWQSIFCVFLVETFYEGEKQMTRHTYNCGGKGRQGRPRGPCTYCGRVHPGGKKQKERARVRGWDGCAGHSRVK